MILLRNCCFFYSLRTGCIVIGAIEGVFSLITLICAAVTVNSENNHGKNSKTRTDLNVLQDSAWRLFIFGAGTVSIIASMLLIIGATNKKSKYLRCWLICMAIVIASFVFYSLWRAFTPETMLMNALPIAIHFEFSRFEWLNNICITAFLVYFWIVVLSYYFETLQRNDGSESQVFFITNETAV